MFNQNNTPVTISIQNNVQSSTSTMAKGLVGLSWQAKTQNMNALLRLGYEGQVWLNQLKIYSFDGGRQKRYALYSRRCFRCLYSLLIR